MKKKKKNTIHGHQQQSKATTGVLGGFTNNTMSKLSTNLGELPSIDITKYLEIKGT